MVDDVEEVELTEENFKTSFIYLAVGDKPVVIKSKDVSDAEAVEWLSCAILLFAEHFKELDKPSKINKQDMSMYG